MKARRKRSNGEWQEIKYVQLEDSDILYKEDYMEFQHDTLSTELRTYEQIEEDKHWQDIRERAAIAAMQGMLSNPELVDTSSLDYRITIEKAAIGYADALVEQLKNK